MPHIKFAAAALAILAFAATSPAFAQGGKAGEDLLVGGRTSYQASSPQAGGGTVSDDVIVDGRIITGENPASAKPAKGTSGANAHGTGFLGGVVVGAGDQGGGEGLKGKAPKTGSLGSLNSVGSIGQLANPVGAPPAQASNNIRQLGLAAHNYDSSRSGGDVNGDGLGDIIVGTGVGGGPHVKSGPGGGPTVKVFDAGRAAAPKPVGATHVKVFSGSTNAAAGAGNAAALKGQAIRKN